MLSMVGLMSETKVLEHLSNLFFLAYEFHFKTDQIRFTLTEAAVLASLSKSLTFCKDTDVSYYELSMLSYPSSSKTDKVVIPS